MDYKKKYEEWLKGEHFDFMTKKELEEIFDDEKEIEDRFYKDLHFGTGGLRGIIGAGTNRMNKYTVGKATKGLANYILKKGGPNPSVVIAHDSRHLSPEFARQAAAVLTDNGIKVYIFEDLRPTPELSFAVRQTNSTAGIVITASHNPPEYNGYKVYWKDGAQIVSPVAEELTEEINSITDFSTIKCFDDCSLNDLPNLHILGEEMDKMYIDRVKALSLNPDAIKASKDLKIVYTPLHGAGNIPVRRVLKEIGFHNVYVVKEQEEPDGSFPTVAYPNPEEPESLELALKLAEEIDGDIIIGTDPDSDRLGVMVKKQKGEYIKLTGNETGVLLTHYIFDSMKRLEKLKPGSFFVDTIVTGKMAKKIALDYGVEAYSTLTGFKNIAAMIKKMEAQGKHFVFAFEESYGYLAGNFVRDKDGVSASMLICEAAAYYKTKKMTLYDGLLSLYEKYGYHREDLISLVLKGREGEEAIISIMEHLRNNPPKELAGNKVSEFRDYMVYEEPVSIPKDNVLSFIFENDSWFAVRPSGTEPKIKIYLAVKGNSMSHAENSLKSLKSGIKDLLKELLPNFLDDN